MSRDDHAVECHGTPNPIGSENTPTCCQEAEALLAECGEELFPLYSQKLPDKIWPGLKSPVERMFVRAHRSEADSRAAEAAAERLKAGRERARSRRLKAHNPLESEGVREDPVQDSDVPE